MLLWSHEKKNSFLHTLKKAFLWNIVSSLYTIIWCTCDEVVVVLWQNIYRIKAKSMFHTEFFSAKKNQFPPLFSIIQSPNNREYYVSNLYFYFGHELFHFLRIFWNAVWLLLIWQPRLKIAQRERKSTLCQVSRNIFASCEYDPTQKNSFALQLHRLLLQTNLSWSRVYFIHIIPY